jgi:hypothetical protein
MVVVKRWGILADRAEGLFRVLQGVCLMSKVWKNPGGTRKHHYKKNDLW